ncbi:MAG TPA: GPW/gp25 family protein [Candidatus Tumulicola sp.]
MSENRFTSLRFSLPALAGVPGFAVTPTGQLATISDEGALRQSLLLLLATTPGERVMRPGYGCDLNRFVFASNDDTTAGLVIHEVRSAIERNEPRVDVVAVDAGADPDDATRMIVDVTYRVRATAAVESIALPVELQA